MPVRIPGGTKIEAAGLAYEGLGFEGEPEQISATWTDAGDDDLILILTYRVETPRGEQSRYAVFVNPDENDTRPTVSGIVRTHPKKKRGRDA